MGVPRRDQAKPMVTMISMIVIYPPGAALVNQNIPVQRKTDYADSRRLADAEATPSLFQPGLNGSTTGRPE